MLITAVLVVAIVATLASYLALSQQIWIRQTENAIGRAQADSMRQAGLRWVAIWLARDAQNNTVDHLGEIWAKQIPPLPAEGGLVQVSVRDAQGLFNLNNLLKTGAPSQEDFGLYRQLLIAQGFDPALTDALAEALRDWMDADDNVQPGGAEDVDYLALPQPYRAANQALTSIDELRLVRGYTAAVVEKLRPYVTVLPAATTINVNTGVEAVLSAMLPNLPATALQTILERRLTQPFTDTAQFLQALPPGTPPPQVTYGINTDYFLVSVNIRIGRLDRRSEALIHRPAGQPATALWYRLNPLIPDLSTDEKT